MSLLAVEEHCVSLRRLRPGPEAQPVHPRQAFKSKTKARVDNFDELSCTATQAEEAYRHAHHICWLLKTLPQQLTALSSSPSRPTSSSAPSTPPAPLSPAFVAEVESPFFPTAFRPPLATPATTSPARASSARTAPIALPRACQHCFTERTPEWRSGPHGIVKQVHTKSKRPAPLSKRKGTACA